MLTKQRLNKIGEWIRKNGRPLETARFEYHFENGLQEKSCPWTGLWDITWDWGGTILKYLAKRVLFGKLF